MLITSLTFNYSEKSKIIAKNTLNLNCFVAVVTLELNSSDKRNIV